jgi:hypothetical protein
MYAKACGAGSGYGMGMDGAGVAIKNQIGDPQVSQKLGYMIGPSLLGAVKWQKIPGAGPKGAVTPVESYAPHLGPGGFQHFAQTIEKGSVRSLKEQESAIITRNTHLTRLPFVCRACHQREAQKQTPPFCVAQKNGEF